MISPERSIGSYRRGETAKPSALRFSIQSGGTIKVTSFARSLGQKLIPRWSAKSIWRDFGIGGGE